MVKSQQERPQLIPKKGERAFIAGKTGSGKTGFSCWLLARIDDSPFIIYDTKGEPKFDNLPNAIVLPHIAMAQDAIEEGESDYIIIRPPAELTSDPVEMDEMLMQHYNNFPGIPAYIDEAYSFHKGNGMPGPGLKAIFTRGRSKGITAIISTQRPAFISLFLISEANKMYIFNLSWKDDKDKLSKAIPDFDKSDKPPKHGFFFYDADAERFVKFGPVKLDKALETGYTDQVQGNVTEAASLIAPKHLWI